MTMTRSNRAKGANMRAKTKTKTKTMDNGDVSLAAVSPAHYELIAALHGLCFDDAWSANTVAQVMNMKGAFGDVAQIGASTASPEPAGFALCHLVVDECEILSLGVAHAYRGRGIGGYPQHGARQQASHGCDVRSGSHVGGRADVEEHVVRAGISGNRAHRECVRSVQPSRRDRLFEGRPAGPGQEDGEAEIAPVAAEQGPELRDEVISRLLPR